MDTKWEIIFDDIRDAEDAYLDMHGYEADGQKFQIKRDANKLTMHAALAMTSDEVRDIFERYGKVDVQRVPYYDLSTISSVPTNLDNKSKWKVIFEYVADAEDAYLELHGQLIDGKNVRIKRMGNELKVVLPFEADGNYVTDLFSKYGKVLYVSPFEHSHANKLKIVCDSNSKVHTKLKNGKMVVVVTDYTDYEVVEIK